MLLMDGMGYGDRLKSKMKDMTVEKIINELVLYLRPPGQGIATFSTGKQELLEFTEAYLKQTNPDWKAHISAFADDRDGRALIAVPCDTGEGILKGASRGPEGIRGVFKTAPVHDLGDVFTIPHFIEDSMLSDTQRRASQDVLYPQVDDDMRHRLPVSPLSILQRVYTLLRRLNPRFKPHLIGGDHGITWAAVSSLLKGHDMHDCGVLQFDAHTDLLEKRLGVSYCFSTWAWHINEQLGRKQRLLQIGIRASTQTKTFWQNNLSVRQIWADEAMEMPEQSLAEKVLAHFKKQGIKNLYISNDLDATDPRWASACGTPEPGGLKPSTINTVLQAIGCSDLNVIGADMMELAPNLSLSVEKSRTSCIVAANYVTEQLKIMTAKDR